MHRIPVYYRIQCAPAYLNKKFPLWQNKPYFPGSFGSRFAANLTLSWTWLCFGCLCCATVYFALWHVPGDKMNIIFYPIPWCSIFPRQDFGYSTRLNFICFEILCEMFFFRPLVRFYLNALREVMAVTLLDTAPVWNQGSDVSCEKKNSKAPLPFVYSAVLKLRIWTPFFIGSLPNGNHPCLSSSIPFSLFIASLTLLYQW